MSLIILLLSRRLWNIIPSWTNLYPICSNHCLRKRGTSSFRLPLLRSILSPQFPFARNFVPQPTRHLLQPAIGCSAHKKTDSSSRTSEQTVLIAKIRDEWAAIIVIDEAPGIYLRGSQVCELSTSTVARNSFISAQLSSWSQTSAYVAAPCFRQSSDVKRAKLFAMSRQQMPD